MKILYIEDDITQFTYLKRKFPKISWYWLSNLSDGLNLVSHHVFNFDLILIDCIGTSIVDFQSQLENLKEQKQKILLVSILDGLNIIGFEFCHKDLLEEYLMDFLGKKLSKQNN